MPNFEDEQYEKEMKEIEESLKKDLQDDDFMEDDFQFNQLFGKHHDRAMRRMRNMTKEQAQDQANNVIGGLMTVAFFFSASFFLMFQGIYILFIRSCQIPQEKLEKHFMGLEVAPGHQSAIRTI